MVQPSGYIDIKEAQAKREALHHDVEGFKALSAKLLALTGIYLHSSPKNLTLMAARLARIIERRGLSSYRQYLELLLQGSLELVNEFISAMTTNTTEFFREARHFEFLSSSLPAFIKTKRDAGHKVIRIWCAASSSGQEVYSILMTMLEYKPIFTDFSLKVLATDIDQEILQRASLACYSEAEMGNVPPLLRHKYFRKSLGKESMLYSVQDSVRRLVTFAPFNLMTLNYPFHHNFDFIFCRNVLIYFSRNEAISVTDKLGSVLNVGGYLYVGHSEVGIVRPEYFSTETSAVYRKI